jgi:hypothetical protein
VIEDWHRRAKKPVLVIVDVFARVRDPKATNDGSYMSDYNAVVPLQEFCANNGIAVLVVHHQRKMSAEDPLDTLSGTTGIAAAADAVLILHRGPTGPVLHGRGREVEEFELALQFDQASCSWQILGDVGSCQISDERKAIVQALRELKEAGPKEIAGKASLKEENVRKLLGSMVIDGDVDKPKRGRYALPATPAPDNDHNDHIITLGPDACDDVSDVIGGAPDWLSEIEPELPTALVRRVPLPN